MAERVKAEGLFDFPAEERVVTWKGKEFRFREMTVGEADKCRLAATDPNGQFDGQAYTKMAVHLSAVEPKIPLEAIDEMPQRLFYLMVEVINELSNPDEGN